MTNTPSPAGAATASEAALPAHEREATHFRCAGGVRVPIDGPCPECGGTRDNLCGREFGHPALSANESQGGK
jgi:hypothetical protein